MAELTPLYMDISSVYSGDELGLPWRDIIGEGVVGSGDLLVSQKAAGADLSVDIAAGAAWVLGDTNPDAQPVYRVRNDATVNKGITPDPSNPRKASVIAQILDETFSGTGRSWELQVIHGTPAASPSEPALPDSALKLAVVDIAAGATSIVDADITDSRALAVVGGGQALGGRRIIADLQSPVGNLQTVLIPNLPFSYIEIIGVARANSAGQINGMGIGFNGDGTTNYWWEEQVATGASTTASEVLTTTNARVAVIPGGTVADGSMFGAFRAVIPTPTLFNGVMKRSVVSEGGYMVSGGSGATVRRNYFGWWNNSAPISSIQIVNDGTGWAPGTRLTVIGVF